MAEIHSLVPRLDAEQACSLGESLIDLIARGVDPGPREMQIRSLSRMLGASVRALREELARLGLPEAATGLDLDRLERAALLTGRYDPDGRSLAMKEMPAQGLGPRHRPRVQLIPS